MNTPSLTWRSRLLRSLPGRVLRPFAYLPRPLTQQGFIILCNQCFSDTLAAGELAFLEQRVLCITLEDAGIHWSLHLNKGRLQSVSAQHPADVTIRGTTYDLLLLMSRREDPDTLFFQRRLRLEGDTELGLHLKNFLDAWEPPASVRMMQHFTAVGMSWAERIMDATLDDTQRAAPIQPDPSNSRRTDPSA